LGTALDEALDLFVGYLKRLTGGGLTRFLNRDPRRSRLAKEILVQSGVIIPRVHVPRNVIRVDGNTFDLVQMFIKEALQSPIGIEVKKVFFKAHINEHGMTTATVPSGLY